MVTIELKLTEPEYRDIISLLGKVEAEFSFYSILNLMKQAEPQLPKQPAPTPTPEA